ncbi:Asp-tRNA(Asn)/Glu-tRNA(Gln) amidotransferase subunit GatC [Patescibacteria group bacterium]
MTLTREDIEHLSKLARLELTEDEKIKFQSQLSSILEYVRQIQKVDTKNVKPSFHIPELKNISQEDAVVASQDPDSLIHAASSRKKRFIQVQAVKDES